MGKSQTRPPTGSPRGRTGLRGLQIAILLGLTLALIVVVGVLAYLIWRDSQVPVAFVEPGGTTTPVSVDAGGTATAACASYVGAHPGTPCPPDLPLAETATAICSQFLELHPGTPCP